MPNTRIPRIFFIRTNITQQPTEQTHYRNLNSNSYNHNFSHINQLILYNAIGPCGIRIFYIKL